MATYDESAKSRSEVAGKTPENHRRFAAAARRSHSPESKKSNAMQLTNEHGRSSERERSRIASRTADRRSVNRPSARDGHVRHAFRSLILGWTDPESGDQLTVDVRGGGEFARELRSSGFEVLATRELAGAAPAAREEHTQTVIEIVAQRVRARARRAAQESSGGGETAH